ncbi:hypothetical protein SAMN04488136_13048 [Vibrio xiamenensis]|uniref:Uncharacterized protein n=1 Tax=Vibrio xiamenensis TaxID=861298 RepID=A0A1G8FG58_9VIBR|nr:DUF6404 family protein [Vibrio xiamenensis]SDH81141.1 hypothetical protein SAMN04488136_13048 [Vibrio xiamenensis]
MENKELIQQRLIEQGVPRDLAKFNTNLLSKRMLSAEKPLVFLSPPKVFVVQSLINGLVWGFLMWIMLWHSAPENWVIDIITMIGFGSFIGGCWYYRISKYQKKLCNISWTEWCRTNIDSAP